jgi:AP-1 complex subunit gamma-1
MLGYDAEFGQLECLKLMRSNNFAEKRMGYLGLSHLFNEKSEVLILATNQIRNDLRSEVLFPYLKMLILN